MTNLPIMVSGLGRCGSSMVMQMLSAAGVPCFGDFPAYEPNEVGMGRDVAGLLASEGAMKIIDPHRSEWPERFDAKIIWLNRDTTQQAKSQLKFVSQVGGSQVDSRQWRGIKRILITDKRLCCKWMDRCESEPLLMSFEDILSDPLTASKKIAAFIEMPEADIQAMREHVLCRKPECRKDMGIEQALCEAVWLAEEYQVPLTIAARRLLGASL